MQLLTAASVIHKFCMGKADDIIFMVNQIASRGSCFGMQDYCEKFLLADES